MSKAALETCTPVDATDSEAILLLEHSVAWLEAAAQVHRHRLLRLSARRNERANLCIPVARLPVEIMRLVFQYDADQHYAYDRTFIDVDDIWLRLSRVCRAWRRIVFDMPTLWANDLYGLGEGQAADVLLPLAREQPLNIDLVHGDSISNLCIDNYRNLLPRAWRINYATFTPEDALSLMNLLSEGPLPCLETLVFSVSTRSFSYKKLPHKLTMAEHPQLRHLTLGNIYMRPPALGMLHSLDINLYEWEEKQKPSIETVMDALSLNKSLRKLFLHYTLGRVKLHPNSPLPRLALPCLEVLSLQHRDSKTSQALLDSMQVEGLKEIILHEFDLTKSVDDALRVFEIILSAWIVPPQQEQTASRSVCTGESLMALFPSRAVDPGILRDEDFAIRLWLHNLLQKFGARISFKFREVEGGTNDWNSFISYTFKRRLVEVEREV